MMRAFKSLGVSLALAASGICFAGAQQPTPQMVIVQAASAPAAATPAAAPPPAETATIDAAIKLLEQTKAANEETLKKQEDLLQQLDEIQKAAEQLKVFSKRT
jgi:hypothetical protein